MKNERMIARKEELCMASESDVFGQWEEDLRGIETAPIADIIDASGDPIDCAVRLQEYADQTVDHEVRARILRVGTTELLRRYNGPYIGRKLEVVFAGGIAKPDIDPKRRQRTSDTYVYLDEQQFARGKFSLVHEEVYIASEGNDRKTVLTVRLKDAHLLDDRSNVREEYDLPDYTYFPVSALKRYAFIEHSL